MLGAVEMSDARPIHITSTAQNASEKGPLQERIIRANIFLSFYCIKLFSLVNMVAVACLFTTCSLNVSLQLYVAAELAHKRNDGKLDGLHRANMYLFLPPVLVFWILISWYALSRVLELVYLVFSIPYFPTTPAESSRPHANEWIEVAMPLVSKKIPMPLIYVLVFICFCMTLVFLGLGWPKPTFLVLSMLVASCNLHAFKNGAECSPKLMSAGILQVLCIINAISLVGASIWGFFPNDDDWSAPLYTKLVIVSICVYGCLSSVYILVEVFIKPANTFICPGSRDENEFAGWIYFFEYIGSVAVILLVLISMIIYTQHEDEYDLPLLIAEFIMLFFFLIATFCTCNTAITSNCGNVAFDDNWWKNNATFVACLFVGLLAIIFGSLSAGNLSGTVWDCLYFVLSCICMWVMLGLPVSNRFAATKEENEINLIWFLCFAVWCILVIVIFAVARFNWSVVLVALIMLHGFVLWSHHRWELAVCNTERDEYSICIPLVNNPVAVFKFNNYMLYKKTNATTRNETNRQDEAICGKRRLPSGTFILLLLLNFAVLFLAAWSQTEPISEADEKVKVRAADTKNPLFYDNGYSVCQNQDFFTLDVVDLAYLTELSYFKDPVDRTSCGLQGNKTEFQMCLLRYFTNSYVKSVLNNQPYSWEVLNISVPSSTSLTQVAYYGIKSVAANLIVVGVRGSTTGRDWLEDASMFSEIAILQLFSLMVPMVYVWPNDATAVFVRVLSFSESFAFTRGGKVSYENYYHDTYTYVNDIKKRYPNYEVMLVGHSLGAAVAQIVGSKIKARAVGFEPPGIVFSHDKFQIYDGIGAIDETSFSVKRDNDLVTWIDKQGGEVQRIDCDVDFFNINHVGYCHLMHPVMCHLASHCNATSTDDAFPTASRFDYWGGYTEYCEKK